MNRITGVLGPVLVMVLGAGSTASVFAAEPAEKAGGASSAPAASAAPAAPADTPADKPADKVVAADQPAHAVAPADKVAAAGDPADPVAPAAKVAAPDKPADAVAPPPQVAPPTDADDAARKAYFLHAEALEAELDREYPRALGLLRKAHELDPKSAEVRFDLARIAALQGGTPDDMRPFFESPQADADGKALRAGVEARLAPERSASEGRRLVGDVLTASLRLGASSDSNVTLAPPDGTLAGVKATSDAQGLPVAGNRFVSSGLIDYAPLRGTLSVDTVFAFNLGRFLEQKDLGGGAKLSQYDANTLTLAGRLGLDLGALWVMVQVAGNDVLIGLGETYLRSLDATGIIALGGKSNHFGIFVDAGARSFGAGNLAGAQDRNGPYVDGGLLFDAQLGRVFGLHGRLGVGTERAAGAEMRTYLALGALSASLDISRVHVSAGVLDEARVYGDIGPSKWRDVTGARFDNRLNPYVRAVVDILDNLGLYAGYSYADNYSTHSKTTNLVDAKAMAFVDSRYTRSFIEAGVEGRL
jgi:hypothetical protein